MSDLEDNQKLIFFKDYFYFEETRSNEVNTQVSLVIGSLSILFGFLAFYLLNMPDDKNTSHFLCLYYLCLFCSFVFLSIGIFYIYKIIKGFKYRYLAHPKELYDVIEEQNPSKEQFEKHITEQYCLAAEENKKSNDSKFFLLGKSKDFLLYALLSLVITFLPYYILMGKEINTNKIEITNKKEYFMSEEKKEQNQVEVKPEKPIEWPKETYVQKNPEKETILTKDLNKKDEK